ncbi:MAG: hypothetical protein JWQ43_3785 [Glaciihabitans sp.]|nr:hypothetical protein [Glaciihabitans sp.]
MPSELTTKQQREARRAEKVAVLKKQQAAQKRNRIITLVGTVAASAGVLALIIAFVVTSSVPKVDPDTIDIAGLQTFDDLPANHVTTPVDYATEYDMSPPAGGNHNQVWLNCGVYTEVQQNENAVHALEHGAVWVTYNADEVAGDDLETLTESLPSTYVIVSPYPDLQAPVVASAWGEQIELDGVDDPRLADFVTKFWKSADAPEPGAACTGAIDGPGKI